MASRQQPWAPLVAVWQRKRDGHGLRSCRWLLGHAASSYVPLLLESVSSSDRRRQLVAVGTLLAIVDSFKECEAEQSDVRSDDASLTPEESDELSRLQPGGVLPPRRHLIQPVGEDSPAAAAAAVFSTAAASAAALTPGAAAPASVQALPVAAALAEAFVPLLTRIAISAPAGSVANPEGRSGAATCAPAPTALSASAAECAIALTCACCSGALAVSAPAPPGRAAFQARDLQLTADAAIAAVLPHILTVLQQVVSWFQVVSHRRAYVAAVRDLRNAVETEASEARQAADLAATMHAAAARDGTPAPAAAKGAAVASRLRAAWHLAASLGAVIGRRWPVAEKRTRQHSSERAEADALALQEWSGVLFALVRASGAVAELPGAAAQAAAAAAASVRLRAALRGLCLAAGELRERELAAALVKHPPLLERLQLDLMAAMKQSGADTQELAALAYHQVVACGNNGGGVGSRLSPGLLPPLLELLDRRDGASRAVTLLLAEYAEANPGELLPEIFARLDSADRAVRHNAVSLVVRLLESASAGATSSGGGGDGAEDEPAQLVAQPSAAVAANARLERLLTRLLQRLHDDNPSLRQKVADAIGRADPGFVVPRLCAAMAAGRGPGASPEARQAAAAAEEALGRLLATHYHQASTACALLECIRNGLGPLAAAPAAGPAAAGAGTASPAATKGKVKVPAPAAGGPATAAAAAAAEGSTALEPWMERVFLCLPRWAERMRGSHGEEADVPASTSPEEGYTSLSSVAASHGGGMPWLLVAGAAKILAAPQDPIPVRFFAALAAGAGPLEATPLLRRLAQQMPAQALLTEALLSRDTPEGTLAVQTLLFARLAPMLVLKALPARAFAGLLQPANVNRQPLSPAPVPAPIAKTPLAANGSTQSENGSESRSCEAECMLQAMVPPVLPPGKGAASGRSIGSSGNGNDVASEIGAASFNGMAMVTELRSRMFRVYEFEQVSKLAAEVAGRLPPSVLMTIVLPPIKACVDSIMVADHAAGVAKLAPAAAGDEAFVETDTIVTRSLYAISHGLASHGAAIEPQLPALLPLLLQLLAADPGTLGPRGLALQRDCISCLSCMVEAAALEGQLAQPRMQPPRPPPLLHPPLQRSAVPHTLTVSADSGSAGGRGCGKEKQRPLVEEIAPGAGRCDGGVDAPAAKVMVASVVRLAVEYGVVGRVSQDCASAMPYLPQCLLDDPSVDASTPDFALTATGAQAQAPPPPGDVALLVPVSAHALRICLINALILAASRMNAAAVASLAAHCRLLECCLRSADALRSLSATERKGAAAVTANAAAVAPEAASLRAACLQALFVFVFRGGAGAIEALDGGAAELLCVAKAAAASDLADKGERTAGLKVLLAVAGGVPEAFAAMPDVFLSVCATLQGVANMDRSPELRELAVKVLRALEPL